MRLKTQIWVQAYLRRCQVNGIYGAVLHRGADEAGAVYVVVNRLDGTGHLYAPAAGPTYDELGERRFYLSATAPQPSEQTADILKKRLAEDPDAWIVEVEDRDGQGLIASTKD